MQTDQPDREAGGVASAGRGGLSRRRKVLIVAGGLVGLGAVGLLLAPTLLSTGPGRALLLGLVNDAVDGRVEARSLSLGWFGGQRVEGVDVTGPGGALVVENLSVEAPDVGLLPLAFGSRVFGAVAMHADAIHLVADRDGRLDLPGPRVVAGERAGTGEGGADGGGASGSVDATLSLSVGTVTFEQPGAERRVMKNLAVGAEVRGNRKVEVSAKAEVVGGDGPGLLDATVRLENLADAAGHFQVGQATFDADIRLTDMPTAMVAAIGGQGQALVDAVGPRLSVSATARGTLERLTADVVLPTLQLPAGEGRMLRFADGRLAVRPGAGQGDLALTLRGTASTGAVAEAVTLDAELRHLFDEAPMGVRLRAEQLPVALLDAVAGQDGRLVPTLGATLGLTLEVTGAAAGGHAVSGTIDAPNLGGAFEAVVDPGRLITFAAPSAMRLRLTPGALDLWTATGDSGTPVNHRLGEVMDAELTVPDLMLVLVPTPEGQDAGPLGMRIDPAASSASLKLVSPRMVVERVEPAARVTAAPVSLVIEGRTLEAITLVSQLESIFAEATAAAVRGAGPAAQAPADAEAVPVGRFVSRVTVQHLFDDQGVLAFGGSRFQGTGTLEDLPAEVPDLLAGQGGQLAGLTGPVIRGRLEAEGRPGEPMVVTATLDATHLKGTVPVRIAADRSAMTLAGDVDVSLAVTEQTAASYLGAVHPLFADAVASDPAKPMRLKIRRENLVIPLDGSFDLAKLDLSGEVDPGTLIMRRSGWIGQAVSGVGRKVFGDRFGAGRSRETFPAVFSPMTVRIKDGVATTGELWMAARDIGLGFQGTVSLQDRQIDRMAVGILAGTFYAFGGGDIRRSVPAGKVIEVPLTGPVSAPRPDLGGLVMANLDTGLDIAAGAVKDQKTAEWIRLGAGILRGMQEKAPGDGGKYTFQWHPSDPAKAFVAQFEAAGEGG